LLVNIYISENHIGWRVYENLANFLLNSEPVTIPFGVKMHDGYFITPNDVFDFASRELT